MALVNETVRILENEQVGPRLWLVTLEAPAMAAAIEPGQFVHMKVPRMEAHILRRPFSVYRRDAAAGTIEILYQVVGFGTDHMTTLEAGEEAELIGPVGNVWSAARAALDGPILLVGGGVGAAPLFMLCEKLAQEGAAVDVILGAQTKDALVTRAAYEALGVNVACATDDGSFGRAGFCTSLVEEALGRAAEAGAPYRSVAVCGPEPLMKIVAGMAAAADVPCEVSMEKRMACGIGACLSCVVETVAGKKRACVDGPVFKAQDIVW